VRAALRPEAQLAAYGRATGKRLSWRPAPNDEVLSLRSRATESLPEERSRACEAPSAAASPFSTFGHARSKPGIRSSSAHTTPRTRTSTPWKPTVSDFM
jgi:hypothetical protein